MGWVEKCLHAVKGIINAIEGVVAAFGGGWEAVVAVGIICLTFIILGFTYAGYKYLTNKSNNRLKLECHKLNTALTQNVEK